MFNASFLLVAHRNILAGNLKSLDMEIQDR